MKRDKRLIILKDSLKTAGSVSFLRNDSNCVARFSFLKKESGVLVVVAQDKEWSRPIEDSAIGTIEFECLQDVIPTFYLVTKNGVLSGCWDGKALIKSKEMGIKYAPKTDYTPQKKEIETPNETVLYQDETFSSYDDEEIAQTNYYPSNVKCITDDLEQEISVEKELKLMKSLRNFRLEKEITTSEKVRYANGREASYYEKAQGKIDLLFKKFERFEILEKLLPQSKWVKIPYDNGGRFYAVGVVGTKPEYVAYAVRDVYKSFAPPAFKDVGVWIPEDVRVRNGSGYWVVFQSCKEGKINFSATKLVD